MRSPRLRMNGIALLTLALAFLSGAMAAAETPAALPAKQEIAGAMELANKYFVTKWPAPGCKDCLPGKRPSNIWTRAVYFEGALALYRVNQDPAVRQYATDWGTFHEWGFRRGDATQNPDDQCAAQAYIELSQLDPAKPEALTHVRANVENWTNSPKLDYYTWIDTFQMSMPVFAKLGVLDNKPAYFEKMHALFDHAKTALGLYNAQDHLWWRDVKFKPPFATSNGKPCYWSRGNGWAIAAMVRVLDVLPVGDPHRAEYVQMLKEMSAALLPLQREDGFWNVNLGDANDFGGPEATGTAFFTYAMAWGIRNGHLPAETYLPAVVKGWNALTGKALHPNGFLGYVQGTGDKPSDGQPVTHDSTPDFDDYGVGAFLLAGSEVYALNAAPAAAKVDAKGEGERAPEKAPGAAALPTNP